MIFSKTRTFAGWPCPGEPSTGCCWAAQCLARAKASDGWMEPSGTMQTSILVSYIQNAKVKTDVERKRLKDRTQKSQLKNTKKLQLSKYSIKRI